MSLQDMGDKLIQAINKRFGKNPKINENVLWFIKDYICKNAETLLHVEVNCETELMPHDFTLYQIRDTITIKVSPKANWDHLSICFQKMESYEDILNRQEQGLLGMRESATSIVRSAAAGRRQGPV